MGLDVGTDIALSNTVAREIIAAGLVNREFVDNATSGFKEYEASVAPWTLERGEKETGVPASVIREMAHTYATSKRAIICWTLGITEHHTAVDNVLSLINLSLLCGHVGKWGSGLNPLRGQNNVQGGGDMGALPDRLPGSSTWRTTKCASASTRRRGVKVPPKKGWHLSGMFDAMERGELRAAYVIGENPVQSEADQHRATRLLEGLDFLVVQDIFLTDDSRACRRCVPGGRGRVRVGRHGDQQRAQGAACAPRRQSSGRGARGSGDRLRHGAGPGPRLGPSRCRAPCWNELRSLSPVHAGIELRAAQEARRPAMALLRRRPSR